MQPRTGAPSLTCLTMHQPWASLLVFGIKRIEGRVWSTQHRGGLWIHAAAKHPSQEDIDVSHVPLSCLTRRASTSLAHVQQLKAGDAQQVFPLYRYTSCSPCRAAQKMMAAAAAHSCHCRRLPDCYRSWKRSLPECMRQRGVM